MQDGNRGNEIYDLMQTFPVFAEAHLPDIERGDSQWNQHQKRGHPEEDVPFLNNRLNDQTPREAEIEVHENDDVDRRVHHGIQSQRAAAFDQFTPAEEIIERRARQRHDQQSDGMTTRALFHGLDGVGGEVMREKIKDQHHQRGPGIQVHGDLQRGERKSLQAIEHNIGGVQTLVCGLKSALQIKVVNLVVQLQVHSLVKISHLFGVAIEQ